MSTGAEFLIDQRSHPLAGHVEDLDPHLRALGQRVDERRGAVERILARQAEAEPGRRHRGEGLRE